MARITSAVLAITALFGSADLSAHSRVVLPSISIPVSQSGWLGVYLSGDSSRPKISEVIPGSPAAKAGLEAGDVFLRVNDKRIGSVDELMAVMGKLDAGAKVQLQVARGDKKIKVSVVLGKRPDADAPKPKGKSKTQKKRGPAPKPVIEVREVPKPKVSKKRAQKQDPKRPAYLGLALDETKFGLRVAEVLKGGPADKAGLREGDVITEFGGKDMRDLASLDRVMSRMHAGQKVEIEFVQRGKVRELEFHLGARPGRKAAGKASSKPATNSGSTRAKSAKRAKPAKKAVRSKTSAGSRATSRPSARPTRPSRPQRKTAVRPAVVKSKALTASKAWGHNLREAMAASRKNGKPVLVVFGADWCVNCHALKKSFADASVKKQLSRFEAVWLDAEKESKLADRFRVQGLPHIAIMVGGKPIKTMTGYYPPEHLVKSLGEHKQAKRQAVAVKSRQAKASQSKRQKVSKKTKASQRVRVSTKSKPSQKMRPSQKSKPSLKSKGSKKTKVSSSAAVERQLKQMRADMRKMRAELGKIESLRKELKQLRGAQKELAEIKGLLKELLDQKKRN